MASGVASASSYLLSHNNTGDTSLSSSAPTGLEPNVDDGAPYYAIGKAELEILLWCKVKLQPMTSEIFEFKFWQLDSGEHAGKSEPIHGTHCLRSTADFRLPVSIWHVIVPGSTPWIVRRNVTSSYDIIHVASVHILFPFNNGSAVTISLVNHRHHSYIPFSALSALSPL